MIERALLEPILAKIKTSKKVVILYGARQTGKTTLAKEIIRRLNFKTVSINADESRYRKVFSSQDLRKMQSLIADNQLLFIDEAQRIPEIGLNLKILNDAMPDLKILTTGSSSYELASKISEPLTGRAWIYTLYPLSMLELKKVHSDFELEERLETSLVYGNYPEVYSTIGNKNKIDLLRTIERAYLYKDALELTVMKNWTKISDLLKLLAFQVGSEVSIQELAQNLEMSRETVNRYINLLEKSFVVFRLSGFGRNLRKEVSKMDKIYFYDLGIRNTVIDNFHDLDDRNDTGQLWENFVICERMKYLEYKNIHASRYFWRTYTGAEIDYIEEGDGQLKGYEIKWNKTKTKTPDSWSKTYPGAFFNIINRKNYLQYIS